MDLGRTDIMIRSGLWRPDPQAWLGAGGGRGADPVPARAESRFRAFILETRILTWSDSHVVMEHRLVSQAEDGSPILNAIALVRAGLYDRREKALRPDGAAAGEIGLRAQAPAAAPEVEAFLRAEETLKTRRLMVQGGAIAASGLIKPRIGPMPRIIDYYFSLVSPWAYIGHAPFMEIVAEARGRGQLQARLPRPGLLRRPAACRSPSATRPGSATGSWNCSAGARSAGCPSTSRRSTGPST